MKAKNIEEFFGTLQQCVIETWRSHLKTSKYSKHIALDEFYKEIPEMVDDLIENYMGKYGKVGKYKNIMPENIDIIEYLNELREMVKDGRKEFFKDSELQSDIDTILSKIDKTLYKLKELKEDRRMKTLPKFLLESLR